MKPSTLTGMRLKRGKAYSIFDKLSYLLSTPQETYICIKQLLTYNYTQHRSYRGLDVCSRCYCIFDATIINTNNYYRKMRFNNAGLISYL